jgi:DNA-nicking Smr family endonuclease
MTDDPFEAHRVPIEGTLDLHAFTPAEIPSVVDEYVRAAHEAGLREVRLIHGRGIGVQRARVQQVLRAHPLVADFSDAPESHLGATVVQLTRPGHPLTRH